MQKFFVLITSITDGVFGGFSHGWDLAMVILISVAASFVVLLAYRYVSSPRLIKQSKESIKAHILAIRLYKDDWRVILKSFFFSLVGTLRYFFLNMVPLLVLLPLLAPLFAQLEIRYGLSPYQPGEVLELKATFASDLDSLEPELVPASWFKPVMAPVYVYAHRQAHWRIEALEKGVFDLAVQTRSGVVHKQVVVGDGPARALSDKRHSGSILDGLLYPVEPALQKGDPAVSLQISYPGRYLHFLGLEFHWLWLHLLVIMVMVLLLKKRFGVEF